MGVALAALERQTSPAEAQAALSLLQAIQSDPASGMAALQDQAGECVPVLLECVKKYYGNIDVRNLAALLLTPLVTSSHVSEALSKLKPGIEHIKTAIADETLEKGACFRSKMIVFFWLFLPQSKYIL